MGIWKSNFTFWHDLLSGGYLYSVVKDGVPATLFQQIVAHAYPIIAVLLVVLNVVLFFRIPRERRRLKTFCSALAAGSVLGWIWGIWMLKIDPFFPGWLNAPWAVTKIEFIMTIEDWIFYPACTALFYMFYRLVEINGTPWTKPHEHWVVIAAYSVVTYGFAFFSPLAGCTEALLFGVPGILLYLFARKTIDIKRFLIFQAFVIGFEIIWDLTAVSLIHYLPGYAWASQWIYLTTDSAGRYYHSMIWFDRAKNPGAWICMNPIEITPWFAVVGGILNYCMFAAGDKLFYRAQPLHHRSRSRAVAGVTTNG